MVLEDKSTGTDTDRSGYRDLLTRASDGDFERVVVREVSRIARNMRDLNRTVGTLVDDHDVSVNIIDDEMILQLLGIAAELEAKLNTERTKAGIAAAQEAGKHTGRPPFGFDTDKEDYLVPNENFDTTLAIIERIESDDKSIRSTANHAGVSRATVRNIVDRKETELTTE